MTPELVLQALGQFDMGTRLCTLLWLPVVCAVFLFESACCGFVVSNYDAFPLILCLFFAVTLVFLTHHGILLVDDLPVLQSHNLSFIA